MKAQTCFPPGLLGYGLLLLMVLSPGTVLAAPPANDNFADATVLTGLPASAGGTNTEATIQTSEPDETGGEGGTSVWWRWTAPASGWVEINTTGSDFDTVLAVYTGADLVAAGIKPLPGPGFKRADEGFDTGLRDDVGARINRFVG